MNFYQSVSTNKALSINRFLDTYTDAVAAYSLRRLRTGHTGYAVEVRRASDNSTKDIGFDADGNFHVSALEEFCSGTDGYVTVWYDQTSNGYDLTQTDTTKQPRIYDSSTGIASLNSNDRAALGNSVGVVANPSLTNSSFSEDMSGGYSYYFVIGGAGYGDAIFMIGDGTTAQVGMRSGTTGQPTHYHTNSSNDRVNVVTTGFSNVNQRTAGHEVIQSAYFDGSSTSSVFISRDDGYNFTGSKTVGPLGSASALGGVIVNALKSSMDRPVQEFIIFGSDKSSQREEIESKINEYYTIAGLNYDLPLDTYTNVTAAYSVRKLRSAYTGYCMEVYNGTTYADIGFNDLNELDVVALQNHCAGNNGYVSKWYDQSTSGDDATQTDTAQMPKIFDATNGIVREAGSHGSNGKVALEFTTSSEMPSISGSSNTYGDVYCVANITSVTTDRILVWTPQDRSHFHIRNGISGGTSLSVHFNGALLADQSQDNMYKVFYEDSPGQCLYSGIGTDQSNYTTYFNRYKYGSFKVQEAIRFNDTSSSRQVDIEKNINAYYSIY